MREKFKIIKGYDEKYLIGNNGTLISLATKTNNQYNKKSIILTPFLNKYGYLVATLYKNSKKNKKAVHRIVAEHFCKKISKKQVNHIDENKLNNNYKNLEWCTPKENINHGTRTQRMKKTQSKAVLQYDMDLNLIKKYESVQSTKKDGFSPGSVHNCITGKYKHHKNFIWRYE